MNANASVISVSQLQQSDRAYALKTKRGDVMGGNFTIPKGDFSRFLGQKEATPEEKAGKVEGWRAVEVAMQREFNKLGKDAMKNGMAYRNMFVSGGKYEGQPGRETDQAADTLDSIRESVDMGHAMGMRYLEMQYKFQLMSTNFGCISNLMKARSESIKKAINEVR